MENNKPKHTTGPWPYEGGDNYSIDIVLPNEATISISRYKRNTDGLAMEREEMEANAKLIAAAPELLETLKKADEVLKTFIEYSDNGWGLTDIHTEIETAIKKATE